MTAIAAVKGGALFGSSLRSVPACCHRAAAQSGHLPSSRRAHLLPASQPIGRGLSGTRARALHERARPCVCRPRVRGEGRAQRAPHVQREHGHKGAERRQLEQRVRAVVVHARVTAGRVLVAHGQADDEQHEHPEWEGEDDGERPVFAPDWRARRYHEPPERERDRRARDRAGDANKLAAPLNVVLLDGLNRRSARKRRAIVGGDTRAEQLLRLRSLRGWEAGARELSEARGRKMRK